MGMRAVKKISSAGFFSFHAEHHSVMQKESLRQSFICLSTSTFIPHLNFRMGRRKIAIEPITVSVELLASIFLLNGDSIILLPSCSLHSLLSLIIRICHLGILSTSAIVL